MSYSEQKVIWFESEWEKKLWRPELIPKISTLIENLASEHGRQTLMSEEIETRGVIRLRYTIDLAGKLQLSPLETSYPRSIVKAFYVDETIRELKLEESAIFILQKDLPNENGNVKRRLVARLDRQKRTIARQMKSLDIALKSGSIFKIQAAYSALTPCGQEFLTVGRDLARQRGLLNDFIDDAQVVENYNIRTVMPKLEILKITMPFSLRAAALPGPRPVFARDTALQKILSVLAEATGKPIGSARRGGYNEPVGAEAQFVRQIEELYEIHLMPKGSTHAITRVKRRSRSQARDQ